MRCVEHEFRHVSSLASLHILHVLVREGRSRDQSRGILTARCNHDVGDSEVALPLTLLASRLLIARALAVLGRKLVERVQKMIGR